MALTPEGEKLLRDRRRRGKQQEVPKKVQTEPPKVHLTREGEKVVKKILAR